MSLAIALIALKLFFSNDIMWIAGTASIGSSIYLVYVQPSSVSAQARNMLLCYLFAFVIGPLFHLLLNVLLALPLMSVLHEGIPYLVGVVAFSFIIFVSYRLATPHPPAAGMALLLTLDVDQFWPVLILFLLVLFLAGSRYILRNKLVDLC